MKPHDTPTRARHTLLWLIFSLTVITYVDRICISAAMPAMAREFNFTAVEKGWIFSAFIIAYAVFEIPSGWLGDRFGARVTLTRIVVWWSGFTMLTGAALGFWSLVIIRFLFGAGEAGAFPNIARAVSRWFSYTERGHGLSRSFIGLAAGSAVTAPLVFTMLQWQGWRWTFVEFGLIGLIWAVIWFRWFRDRPEDHPAVNRLELELIHAGREETVEAITHSVPWKSILISSNMIFICLMYFAFGYGIYFYITWLPTYLLEARGFSINSTKWLSSLPWVVSIGGFWFGGWITDTLVRRTGSLKLARNGIGVVGYAASAVALIAVTRTGNDILAAVLLAAALCMQTTTTSAAWSVCLDIGQKNAGVVTGLMNTVGNIGGALAPLVVGYALNEWNSWTLPFYIMAGVFMLGVVMWLLIDPDKTLN